jgi:hypothetical protein
MDNMVEIQVKAVPTTKHNSLVSLIRNSPQTLKSMNERGFLGQVGITSVFGFSGIGVFLGTSTIIHKVFDINFGVAIITTALVGGAAAYSGWCIKQACTQTKHLSYIYAKAKEANENIPEQIVDTPEAFRVSQIHLISPSRTQIHSGDKIIS